MLPRIVQPIDESKLAKLTGNVPMVARPEFDQGEAAPSLQLTHIRLVLNRSQDQEAALDKYQAELQDKSSPNYHKWLTPEQFGKLYGPAGSDIAAIVAWAESHGLQLENVSTGRIDIALSGTVSQVEEAFHTKIHSFEVNGQHFYSNIMDPSIPAALATVVQGVAHLNTIRPKAFHVPGPSGTVDPETKRLAPASAPSGPRANLTAGNGTANDPYFLYIVPGDAATIYDTPNSFNANYSTGASYTGSGVTIGIGGDATILTGTVGNYRTNFLGSPYASSLPTIVNVDGVTSTEDTDEAYIDTELSGGLAPGASLIFYTSTDLISGIEKAIDTNTVDIFSLSFGLCELELTTSGNTLLEQIWQQAATQGVAVTVSTGDTGSASCDAIDSSPATQALYGLSVSGYASTPYNIAVGGTDLYALNNGFSTYASTSEGSASTFYRTALKYIGESTWNDSSQTDTTISANVPFTGADANIVAGNGGPSSCSTNTNTSTSGAATGTCTSGYAKPTWQHGAGFLPDNVRDLPDLSLMSGNGYDPATWLVCTDDFASGSSGPTDNCALQSGGKFHYAGFGGTSTAAPAFAGILALVEQSTGSRLGQAAQVLYSLYNSSNAGAIFHDITVGNNSVPCASGSPDCIANALNDLFESGYNTADGYDLATGMGSVDVTQLIADWNKAISISTATVTATPSSSSINNDQSLTVAATVAGGAAGTPTGTVTLSGGGYTSASEPLTSGAYTFTVPSGSLSTGSDSLTVEYGGDANYGSASAAATVTVTAASPIASLSPTSLMFASTKVGTSAASQTTTLTNTGTGALFVTGISIAGTNPSSFSQTNNCGTLPVTLQPAANCTITVTFTPASVGSLTASVSVADNATGSPQTVSLTGAGAEPAGASYTLSAATVTVAPGATGTSAITAAGTGGYVGPITVTLSNCALATSPSGAIDSPSCAVSSATLTFASGSASGAGGAVTIATTVPTSSAVKRASLKRNTTRRWALAGGVAVASLLLVGIPARRRNWKSLLGLLVFAAAIATLSSCGGGGGGGGGGSSGTTAGAYTFTLTGADSNGVVETVTISVTVS